MNSLHAPQNTQRVFGLIAVSIVAAIVPPLLAFNLPPSATLLNQALALLGWGGAAVVLVRAYGTDHPRGSTGLIALLVAYALLFATALASPSWTGQPWALALSSAGTLTAAVLLVLAGAAMNNREAVLRAMCWAYLVAGLLSVAVGMIQVFAPGWADGEVIAHSSIPGRAVGNLRQPNHLSTLLLWSAISVVWLREAGALRDRVAGAMYALIVFGVVLSASRTGVVGVLMLMSWGVLDRRLSRSSRVLLITAPLLYAVFWLGLAAWAHLSHHTFGGEGRFTVEGDLSSSRFAIWSNTLALIKQNPWTGVGFGEFNFAWTLTPFPDRPVAFFDHTHNLVLQFLVELGIPLGSLVLALLGYALWRAFVAARAAEGLEGTTLRCAFMMVLLMMLHSQLEYPLWYAYFLLPTALLFGLCLGGAQQPPPASAAEPRKRNWLLMTGGLLIMLGGVVTVIDYLRVVPIFAPPDDAPSLAERIADGQRSWFFAHHADYAAATTTEHPAQELQAFKRASHYLLDTRLMMAWAHALHDSGDEDRARYVAQRLREFRNPQAKEFFEPCEKEALPGQALPFQCLAPTRALGFRDFR